MAKKYTSINFNHIYDKTGTTDNNTNNAPKNSSISSSSSFSSPSYSAVSAPNKHGRILVLTRPTPKPVTPPIRSPSPSLSQPQNLPNQIQQLPDRPRSESGSDAISLRPLGRTGTGTGSLIPAHVANHDKEKDLTLISPKPDKFVPPHLRPGFVAREQGPGPEVFRPRDAGQRRQGHVGSPGRYAENGRPKSGGYEMAGRGGGSDMGILGRPRSSGSRPNSSG